MKKNFSYNQSGQAFILSVVVLFLILLNTIILLSGSLNFFNNSRYTVESLSATNLAEAGIDKAVATLNATGGNYNPDPDTEVTLGNGTFTTSVTNINAGTKKVQVTGYIPDKAKAKAKKTVELLISKGTGIAFSYGVQVGQGGLNMQNNATVNGSVYSNGNIVMSNGATITGDSYVAGGVQSIADQENDCLPPNCGDYIFGKSVSGSSILDVAQSFIPTSTTVINKIALKLKKTGSPPNVTVRILGNTGSNPNKNDIKATGTLSASLVTNQYGFIEVTLNTTPTLIADTTYWIVIDTSNDTNNYWYWHQDTLQSYSNGVAKWSPNWNAGSPVWNNPIPQGDFSFKVFMGGVVTSIIGANNARINGDAHANTLQSLVIGQDAYYQNQSDITASGQNCTSNTHCHPNSIDPVSQPMPVSEGNIQDWQDLAEDGGTQSGVSGCPSTMAQKKYIGDVLFTNNCTVTINAPIWITGNFELNNGALVKLDSTFGASSGVIIVDGTIKLSNNGRLQGSGTAGSYLMALSNYDSTVSDNTAIESDNGSSSMILYANKGKIVLKNNASLKEVTGWKLQLDNGSSVTYDTGLAGLFFSSGAQGAFTPIKGTYQTK